LLEAASSLDGGFDLRVQSFHYTIRNTSIQIVDDSQPITFDGSSHFYYRIKPAVCGPKKPALKIDQCLSRISYFPESGQCQFDVIGSGYFQVQGLEFLQSLDLTFTQIHGIFKPQIPSILSALF